MAAQGNHPTETSSVDIGRIYAVIVVITNVERKRRRLQNETSKTDSQTDI